MGIIDTILSGLMWIIAGAIILITAAGVILGVYMSDKERIEREQEASKAESSSTDPAAKRRRRRAAQGHAQVLS